jgi:uncharacterized protein YceK
MKAWIMVFYFAAISACGTIQTINDEKGAADNLAVGHSNCHSIPRTYSGLAYNYCVLDAPERYGAQRTVQMVLIDALLSSVSDTFLLPYTVYQQNERGSIQVQRKR